MVSWLGRFPSRDSEAIIKHHQAVSSTETDWSQDDQRSLGISGIFFGCLLLLMLLLCTQNVLVLAVALVDDTTKIFPSLRHSGGCCFWESLLFPEPM